MSRNFRACPDHRLEWLGPGPVAVEWLVLASWQGQPLAFGSYVPRDAVQLVGPLLGFEGPLASASMFEQSTMGYKEPSFSGLNPALPSEPDAFPCATLLAVARIILLLVG